MTRPQALMEAVAANLNWFLQHMGENLTKPQKKFLRDGLIGLLRAGRTVVCRMVRKPSDRRERVPISARCPDNWRPWRPSSRASG